MWNEVNLPARQKISVKQNYWDPQEILSGESYQESHECQKYQGIQGDWVSQTHLNPTLPQGSKEIEQKALALHNLPRQSSLPSLEGPFTELSRRLGSWP